MIDYFLAICFVGAAYLIGSVSSAILICKALQLPDPRTEGSGNPGTTNVLRIGGKKAAALTLLGDMLKGFVPVLLAMWIKLPILIAACVGLAAFLGHIFPVFFKFKGGKGVATFLGALLGLSFLLGFSVVATWLLVAILFRYASLSGLVSAFFAPLYGYYFFDGQVAFIISVMSVILILKHHENIKRLAQGKEGKLR